jgi:methylated-DNA-[protein]-cysteine S-methyltransferase
MQILYGETDSYLGLSKTLGNEKAVRAVAIANGANAIAIIIPCHRIIGSDGSLVGYAGGLPAKKKLLALENPGKEMQLTLL